MNALLGVNRSHVVFETIDGETILIHLGTGTYYSVDGAGSEAWEFLAAGATLESLLAAGPERYLGNPLEIEQGLSALVEQLLREDLLVALEGPAGEELQGTLPAGRLPFAVPVLQV